MFKNNGDPILKSLKRFTVVLITCHIMRCIKLINSIKCCFRANFSQLNDREYMVNTMGNLDVEGNYFRYKQCYPPVPGMEPLKDQEERQGDPAKV